MEHIHLELAACIGWYSNIHHPSNLPEDAYNDGSWMWDCNTWSEEVVRVGQKKW
jgi:hypothetical protein